MKSPKLLLNIQCVLYYKQVLVLIIILVANTLRKWQEPKLLKERKPVVLKSRAWTETEYNEMK